MRTSTDPKNDEAVSEVVGTMVAIGVVVAMATAVAVHVGARPPAEAAEPIASVATEARTGTSQLSVTHTGGAQLDAGNVRLVVTAGPDILYDGPLGPAGQLWAPGDTLDVDLTGPVPAGADVQASFAIGTGPAPIAPAVVRLTSGPIAPGMARLSADIVGSTGTRTVEGTEALRVETTISHDDGRKLIRSVTAEIIGLSMAATSLGDDGTEGDTTAHDGVYTGYLTLPLGIEPGDYTLRVTVVDLYGETAISTRPLRVSVPTLEPIPAEPPTPIIPPSTPPFLILPTGGIQPQCAGPMGVEIVGVDITSGYNGPRIPVYAWTTLNGGRTFVPFNNGAQVWGGMRESMYVQPGDIVGARGTANGYGFYSSYTSFTSDPHVRVLKNGDLPPDVPAFGTIQQDVATYLGPYVKDGRISLAPSESIVLFEFVSNLNSAAADFQDLVVLFDFACDTPAGPIVHPDSTNLPCTELPGGGGWTELKFDPPRNGTLTSGPVSVTVSGFDGKRFNWTSTHGMDAVYVKAGSAGSNLYVYAVEARGGVGLTSPGASGNLISHISFCYDLP